MCKATPVILDTPVILHGSSYTGLYPRSSYTGLSLRSSYTGLYLRLFYMGLYPQTEVRENNQTFSVKCQGNDRTFSHMAMQSSGADEAGEGEGGVTVVCK